MARGAALGPDQPVILHLLDIEPAKQALEGVRMELVDSAYPLLAGKAPGAGPVACTTPAERIHDTPSFSHHTQAWLLPPM